MDQHYKDVGLYHPTLLTLHDDGDRRMGVYYVDHFQKSVTLANT